MRRKLLPLFAVFALGLVSVPAGSAEAAEPPWLGVLIRDGGGGASVIEVITGSPADVAGLRSGDVILSVATKRTFSAGVLISTVANLTIGSDVEVTFKRAGEVSTVMATLTARLTESELLARRLVDNVFPSFELPVLAGDGSGDSDDHVGDVVVFYFYTSACQTCSALNASLEELNAEDDVQVIGISSAQRSRTTQTSAKRTGIPETITLIYDTGAMLFSRLQTSHLPIVIVTDRKRFVRYAALGKTIDIKDVRFAARRAISDE